MKTPSLSILPGLAAAIFVLISPVTLSAADTNAPATAASSEAEEIRRGLLTSLRLQEQLHTTLTAIEQARASANAEAKTNSEALAARLELLEKSLSQQRESELRAAQSSTRMMLMGSGLFAGIGLLALLVSSWFQLRGMHRLTEIASGLPATRNPGPLNQGNFLGNGDPHFNVDTGSLRLLEALDRIERRVKELEHGAPLPTAATVVTTEAQPVPHSDAPAKNGEKNGFHAVQPAEEKIPSLLGKGQVLLHLSQLEEALVCFNAALAQEPKNLEALMKKGATLERLRRFDDAVACYEKAAAIDPTFTQALLAKGAVFNLLERYNEALECYEQAIQSQQRMTS